MDSGMLSTALANAPLAFVRRLRAEFKDGDEQVAESIAELAS